MPYGGAKAVIMGDPSREKSRPLLMAYAKAVAHGFLREIAVPTLVVCGEEDIGPRLRALPTIGPSTAR
jgi:glutamate dehydrogenase/leucine dehydrogenase